MQPARKKVIRPESPIAGIVADRQIIPALKYGGPACAAVRYYRSERLWVMVDVPERSVADIHAGQM